MRILSDSLIKHAGRKVSVQGWLHKKKLLGGITFINIRDRKGIVQVLVEDKEEVEKLRGMQLGTVLEVNGLVVKDERAQGGVELHDASLEVLVPVKDQSPIEIDKPLDHKSENLDTLFEYRAVGLRNLNETTIFKIRSEVNRYLREFLYNQDFTEIQTPKLVAGAAEGGAEVFKLDYFGQEATLAQSPQLYKQIMVGVFERVFEIGPTFRAELSATTRHVSEVTMLDLEIGFINGLDDVLNIVQDMVYFVTTKIQETFSNQLKKMNITPVVLTKNFPRFTIKEIHELYSKSTGKDTTKEPDLIPDEEKWICDYSKKKFNCEAVFATYFPTEVMKFYHAINPEDASTVLWGDLLFRGVEIATCPMRENNLDVLISQMKKGGIDINHPGFKYYLQAFQFGLPVHGGCGFGVDRFVQKILNLQNVKEAILFPRDINRLTP